MNFCIHTTIFAKESILFATFLPTIVFPMNYTHPSLYFILLPVIRYNWCRGKSYPCILSGTILKLLFAIILTFEIVLPKSAFKKIGMIL